MLQASLNLAFHKGPRRQNHDDCNMMLVCQADHYGRDSAVTMFRYGSGYLALFCTAVALAAIRGATQDSDEGETKSRAALDAWLVRAKQEMPVQIEPDIILITDKTVHEAFPHNYFYGIYFRRWPGHAIKPPEELSLET